jgi:ATP-dependent DNA helicase RecG
MYREDETNEFKKSTSELNEAMISISSILNKHGNGVIYFGLKNDGTPNKFTINDSTIRDVSRKIYESIKPQIFPEIKTETIDDIDVKNHILHLANIIRELRTKTGKCLPANYEA